MYTKTFDLYDDLYEWKDYAAEARALRRFLPAAPRGRRRTLLDVACGTGKHLAVLRKDFDVEGTDVNPKMLGIARRRLPGVRLTTADLEKLDLGRTFDAVTCLFSSVGYVRTLPRLRRACASLAAHVAPGGVLILEPWLTPAAFHSGTPHMTTVSRPDLKLARACTGTRKGRLSILDMHHVVSTGQATTHRVERHVMGLFTDAETRAALRATGLIVRHDKKGLMGRGLWIATRPAGVTRHRRKDRV